MNRWSSGSKTRTAELTRVNEELAQAQMLAEEANLGKTRFLAAAGHDILQPLNAARLYCASLIEKAGKGATGELPLPGVRDHAVREALRALRDDLGYETATLFVAGLGEWTPIHRAGPERPWHALLDPSVAPDQDEPVELGDVRAIPGIGARLAGLGCGERGRPPPPGGGKVVLDSSMPSIGRSWLERARPYLSLISIMSGPAWTQDGALLAHQDLEVVARVFAACRP